MQVRNRVNERMDMAAEIYTSHCTCNFSKISNDMLVNLDKTCMNVRVHHKQCA